VVNNLGGAGLYQEGMFRGKIPVDPPVVAIHQPNYIPWLGYFYKIARANKFVFLDTVPYPKGSYINRNSIKKATGPGWLTIPIAKSGRSGQLIRDVQTCDRQRWQKQHLKSLQSNYGRAAHFKEISAFIESHYTSLVDSKCLLAEFNIGLIRAIATFLGIEPLFLLASELGVSGHKTELLLDICRKVGARTYLAGTGARQYQDDSIFSAASIAPVYSEFSHPRYPQLFGDFVQNLSIVDALMNCGRQGTRQLLGLEPAKQNSSLMVS
jgi:WbqC-like protein family